MPKKNEILRLEITDITPEGAGVGRCDGYVLFVSAPRRGTLSTRLS